MAHQHYEPRVGDRVTTVSLFYGYIVGVKGDELTVRRDDRTEYLAHRSAVIRVSRDGVQFAIDRRANGSCLLLPLDTSFGQNEYNRYQANRVIWNDTAGLQGGADVDAGRSSEGVRRTLGNYPASRPSTRKANGRAGTQQV